jgi:type IV pilus assembly protein PilC
MPNFFYIARGKTGQKIQGNLSASDKHALARLLRDEGLILVKAKIEKKKSLLGRKILGKFTPVSLLRKQLFTKHLAVMLKAGLPLSRALRILAKGEQKGKFKNIITDLHQGIEKGDSFTKSLEKYSDTFPSIFVSMVRVGETSGRLEEVLKYLSLQMKKDYDLKRKVKGAMIYPVIILCLMIGVAIMMVIVVIPKLIKVFEEAGVILPLTTRILVSLTNFLLHNGLLVGLGLGGVGIILFLFGKRKTGSKFTNKLWLILPVISGITKKVNLARFARTLSSLIKSGVPIVQSLNITALTLGNIYYRNILFESAKEVRKGTPITNSVESQKNSDKLFPPVVTQMIAVGEETGTLDSILEDLALFYEQEVSDTMQNLSSIIEPLLMVILGLGVGLMAVSIITPIYGLMGQV